MRLAETRQGDHVGGLPVGRIKHVIHGALGPVLLLLARARRRALLSAFFADAFACEAIAAWSQPASRSQPGVPVGAAALGILGHEQERAVQREHEQPGGSAGSRRTSTRSSMRSPISDAM